MFDINVSKFVVRFTLLLIYFNEINVVNWRRKRVWLGVGVHVLLRLVPVV